MYKFSNRKKGLQIAQQLFANGEEFCDPVYMLKG